MPRPLTTTQRDMAITMLKVQKPQIEIADAASCSLRQVQRIKENMAKWGTPTAPKLRPQGRPRALVQAEVDVRPNPVFFDSYLC